MTNFDPATQPTAPAYPAATAPQEPAMSYAPAPYSPYAPAPVAQDPGRTLGIVGLVLSFLTALVGLVVSIVALRKSRRAGFKNGFALAGTIVGGLGTLVVVIALVAGGFALGGVAAKCKELGPGTHTVNGVTYTCS